MDHGLVTGKRQSKTSLLMICFLITTNLGQNLPNNGLQVDSGFASPQAARLASNRSG